MAYTQEERLIAVITNAGENVLLLDHFSGTEGISRDFRFVLKMLAEVEAGSPARVKPHNLVGTSMSIRIDLWDPKTGEKTGDRYFTGLCERFVQEDQNDKFASYTAVIVPWFSFLEYNTNCRIFQDKSTPDIISAIVAERGFAGQVKLELINSYTPRAYCVQYRESDRHFLSRLMESEGIFYYFKHDNGNHIMVLSDAPAGYRDLPNKSSFNYSAVTGMDSKEDTIRSWRIEEEMHAGLWTYRDYHDQTPRATLESSTPSDNVASAGKKLEVFDYPGGHAKKYNAIGSGGDAREEGVRLSRIRMEKEETSHTVVSGWSVCRPFTSGYRISVNGGFAKGSYLLTQVEHSSYQFPPYETTEVRRKGYTNSFRAIPDKTVYSHPAEHGRPAITGLQTARIIDESPSGKTEEIWPDKYGRVLVRFHWDREAKHACWLRVVQPWAGKQWGQQWIPRVGDEVAVSFLEGDPDCPVVVGSIYNDDNMPIFTLPDNKTQSGILTRSTKKGGASNYNMLRFEDKIGAEEIYTQAEKDQNALIKNNETRTVKNDRTSTIHRNDTRTVETGEDKIDVQTGSRTVTVKQNISTEAKDGYITVAADKNYIEVSSPTRITLTCGGSKINMTPSNITLTQGGTTIDLTAAMATHTAGLIKLNS